jgi:putative phosphoesterase
MGNKILALSDIHGNMPAIIAVLKWAAGELTGSDMAVFLGDGLQELYFARQQAGLPCEWKRVRGNNDYAAGEQTPESDFFDFCGHRFYLCHGHRHALYSGFDRLAANARNAGADAVLFGHIHAPWLENVNGIFLVCPGSLGRARSRAGETFAVIECEPGKPLAARFWGIDPGCNIREIAVNRG